MMQWLSRLLLTACSLATCVYSVDSSCSLSCHVQPVHSVHCACACLATPACSLATFVYSVDSCCLLSWHALPVYSVHCACVYLATPSSSPHALNVTCNSSHSALAHVSHACLNMLQPRAHFTQIPTGEAINRFPLNGLCRLHSCCFAPQRMSSTCAHLPDSRSLSNYLALHRVVTRQLQLPASSVDHGSPSLACIPYAYFSTFGESFSFLGSSLSIFSALDSLYWKPYTHVSICSVHLISSLPFRLIDLFLQHYESAKAPPLSLLSVPKFVLALLCQALSSCEHCFSACSLLSFLDTPIPLLRGTAYHSSLHLPLHSVHYVTILQQQLSIHSVYRSHTLPKSCTLPTAIFIFLFRPSYHRLPPPSLLSFCPLLPQANHTLEYTFYQVSHPSFSM